MAQRERGYCSDFRQSVTYSSEPECSALNLTSLAPSFGQTSMTSADVPFHAMPINCFASSNVFEFVLELQPETSGCAITMISSAGRISDPITGKGGRANFTTSTSVL